MNPNPMTITLFFIRILQVHDGIYKAVFPFANIPDINIFAKNVIIFAARVQKDLYRI